jgi:hypothetical protein
MAVPPYAAAGPSPFDAHPWLLVDAQGPLPHIDAAQRQAVAAWLLRQPCPVIAIGGQNAAADPWRSIYDVVLTDEASATPLLANIEHAPLAAMTLVQVLRATDKLPIAEGLLVESLAYATLQGGAEFRRWSAEHPPLSVTENVDGEPAVLIERQGNRLEVRLNRPARRNALSVEMRDGLVEALQLVVADPTIECARISGNGACFSTGGDLAEFGTAPDPASAHAIRSLRLPAALAAQCAPRLQFHVHGACIGSGIEIPAFAGRLTAARKSFFQLPEIRFGLMPGAGGCVSLPRRIGRQRTAWLALSTRRIDAATALEWGLVDELID